MAAIWASTRYEGAGAEFDSAAGMSRGAGPGHALSELQAQFTAGSRLRPSRSPASYLVLQAVHQRL